MREKAMCYYDQKELSCSECIIKAADDKYNINICPQVYQACGCLSNGLGVGSTCCALEAGIMIFGIMFNERTCTRLRTKLLTRFQDHYSTIYCCKVKKQLNKMEDCREVIGDIANMIDELISEEIK